MQMKVAKSKKVNKNSFQTISIIGQGSYAKVALVRKIDTDVRYALKILKKKMVKKKQQLEHLATERDVLINVKHPFVVKLAYSFQTEKKLYFAMEYCPGGELFNLLQKRRKLTEEQARFYVSQIVLVIEHLHSKDIIYRDLKPENVLLDTEGYIRVADFGLSKSEIKGNNARSICGTPEYLAPEIVWKMGHGKPVDWWAVGCILYELLTGQPPYYSRSQDRLFQKIKVKPVKMPKKISKACEDLLSKLFQKNPDKRLGTNKGSIELKNHKWFSGVKWDLLLKKRLPAPFVPLLKADDDISHFDPEFTVIEPSKGKDGTFVPEDKLEDNTFKGFTYTGSQQDDISPSYKKQKIDED